MQNLDGIVIAASRSSELKRTVESIKTNIVTNRKTKWFLHNDCLNEDESKKVMEIGIENFNNIESDYPMIGQLHAIYRTLQKTTAKYILYWQDDFILKEKVDIDKIIALMDNNTFINQITFFKTTISGSRDGHPRKEIERNGIKLTAEYKFVSMVGIWRASFIKPIWSKYIKNIGIGNNAWALMSGQINNAGERKHGEWPDIDWVIANVGAFYYGGVGFPSIVEHIGQNKSARLGNIK